MVETPQSQVPTTAGGGEDVRSSNQGRKRQRRPGLPPPDRTHSGPARRAGQRPGPLVGTGAHRWRMGLASRRRPFSALVLDRPPVPGHPPGTSERRQAGAWPPASTLHGRDGATGRRQSTEATSQEGARGDASRGRRHRERRARQLWLPKRQTREGQHFSRDETCTARAICTYAA